jgi:addiction module HigA family antidote
MGELKMGRPLHPGAYIKDRVIPPAMPVKKAAELLGVGRPALSNVLNGNAALSPEMAFRLEKAFGADQQQLLKMQADFDQYQQRTRDQSVAVRAYVPSFLKITARDIEQWAEGNLEARSHLPVLLRKLIHSTGLNLSLVDFPGYDSAERQGWDGRVDSGEATPWIPLGKSGWEFGCDNDPKRKADGDYSARVKTISAQDRSEMNFVFVTPRKWPGRDKWVKEKEKLGDWKSVRAYDSSNLEQWLEQSIVGQGWLAERMGSPSEGVHSLEQQWHLWASVTNPELSTELFATSVEHYRAKVKSWIENSPSSPLIVCGDSKLEALAFLFCLFDINDPVLAGYKDRIVVFSSPGPIRKLTTATPSFVPVVYTEETERELGGIYKNRHTIIIRPRNTVEPEPTIVRDLLGHEAFSKALATMGIDNHLAAGDLARQSGHSPTILRRRLSENPAIRTPEWAQDPQAIRGLIPMMLVGAWHTPSNADCEILSFLASVPYDEIERQITGLVKFDDPPIWSVGKFRGVASKIDAFFSVQTAVTQKDLDAFLFAAEVVLSEADPALELPEDKRAFANLYGKTREHSGALREGICETLVLLAVHGNDLFSHRLGIEVGGLIDGLIRRLLTPLTEEKLLSHTRDLPLYAEAAPLEFLRILEEDLKIPDPQILTLMKPAETGMFGGCPRTGLLWALENLAWNSEQLPRVCLILAKLAERKIDDNWANKPGASLQAIFRSWMPQTAAPLAVREKALQVLAKKSQAIGWEVCVAQFAPGSRVGGFSHRPRWRNDASGAGQPVARKEMYEFGRKALELALAWTEHDENTLGDLVANLQGLPEEDQDTVWNLIDGWAAKEKDESRKATLREKIRQFAFSRRGRGLKTEVKDRARLAYDLLTPTEVGIRHQWLFEKSWVQESFDELEEPEPNYERREERINKLRVEALQEIWKQYGFAGIKTLLSKSGAAGVIGWHMAGDVIERLDAAGFIKQCLEVDDRDLLGKFDEVMRAFLVTLDTGVRLDATHHLLKVLSRELVCRYLKCCPFQHETWEHVDSQSEDIRQDYWREINPAWLMKDSPDLNEAVDRLLEAHRPRAAFHAAHFALKEIETSRLKRLLQDIGTIDSETSGTYRLDGYYLSEALTILQGRSGVSEEEMARLEFLYISALEHANHGIPNLEKQIGKSPALFVQSLALIFRRSDGGEDPSEWLMQDAERQSAVSTAAYRLLENVKRIPGTDENGKIDEKALRSWVMEAQSLCVKYGRSEIGDQKIGQLLSAPVVGEDGVWPCEAVRAVLEECGTSDIATGVQVGVYNSRGVHFRGEGGGQERDLAEKYRTWSRKLAFEYPYVADLVEGIVQTYDRQAEREDTDAAVRKRLRY